MSENDGSAKYRDIIDLPRRVSDRHAQMPLSGRAAQFSPFAALAGYEDAIIETARHTEQMIDLSEEEKTAIGAMLFHLSEMLDDKPKVSVRYFAKDQKKDGGEYRKIRAMVTDIDPLMRRITLGENVIIEFDNIISIERDT